MSAKRKDLIGKTIKDICKYGLDNDLLITFEDNSKVILSCDTKINDDWQLLSAKPIIEKYTEEVWLPQVKPYDE
jgi:hypothetical protein